MIIYLDNDYKCHLENDGTMRPYETDAFDGKCQTYIEGHRLVPDGETWVRDDGVEFKGLMIAPWIDYSKLEFAQLKYELEDADAALREVGAW